MVMAKADEALGDISQKLPEPPPGSQTCEAGLSHGVQKRLERPEVVVDKRRRTTEVGADAPSRQVGKSQFTPLDGGTELLDG